MVVAAVVIVIVVVAAAVGGYYLTQSPAASPSPSATPTTTPAGTSTPAATETPAATASPAPSTEPIINFKSGAWANYTLTSYDETANTTMPMDMILGEGTFNGTDCWTMNVTTSFTNEGSTIDTIMVWYMNKTTSFDLLNLKMITYMDGAFVSEDDYDPTNATQFGDSPSQFDPTTIVGQESITVPAGTFDCMKATVTDATSGNISNTWFSSTVPLFGMVKQQTLNSAQVVTSETILEAYGGFP